MAASSSSSSSSSVHRRRADACLQSHLQFSLKVLPQTLPLLLLLLCGNVFLNPAGPSAVVSAAGSLFVGDPFNLLENSFASMDQSDIVCDIRHIIVPGFGAKGYASAWGWENLAGASTDDIGAKWGQIWEFDVNLKNISVLCGSRVKGRSFDGNASTAAFFGPAAIAVSGSMEELYVLESCTDTIRVVNLTSPEKSTRPLVKFTGNPNAPKAIFYTPGSKLNMSSNQMKCEPVFLDVASSMVYDAAKEKLYISTKMSIMEVDLKYLNISVRYPYVAPQGECVSSTLSTNGSSLVVPDINNATVVRFGLDQKRNEVILGEKASTVAGAGLAIYGGLTTAAAYFPDDRFLLIGTNVESIEVVGAFDHLVQLVEFDSPDGKVIDVRNTNARFTDTGEVTPITLGRALALANYGTGTPALVVSTMARTSRLWIWEMDPDMLMSSAPIPSSSSSPPPSSSAPPSDDLLSVSSISALPSSAALPSISLSVEPSLNFPMPIISISAVPSSAILSPISNNASLNDSAESLSQLPRGSIPSAATPPSWSSALSMEMVFGLVLCWAGILNL